MTATVLFAEQTPRMIPYVYEVHVEMLHPVRAKPGDRLVVRPGNTDAPLFVSRNVGGTWTCVHVGPPNFGAVIGLESDGVLTQLYPQYLPLSSDPAIQRQA